MPSAAGFLDYDYFFLIYLPIGLSALLAFVLRKRIPWPLALGLSLLAVALVGAVLARSWTSLDSQAVQGILCFVALPLSAVVLASQLDVVLRRRWLLLLIGPVAFFVAFVLGVNIWLWLGNPI